MKKILIFLVLCFTPSLFLLGASDPQQVLAKLDSLEKTISNLSFRILALEKRIISLEEKIFLESTRSERQPRKKHESPEHTSNNFTIENITCETRYNNTIFKGNVTNNTNTDYRYTLFKITIYGKNGTVLSNNDFYILNIDRGTTREFEATIHGFKKEEFERYNIEFTKGS